MSDPSLCERCRQNPPVKHETMCSACRGSFVERDTTPGTPRKDEAPGPKRLDERR